MSSRIAGRLLLVSHESATPRDEEWDASVAQVGARGDDALRVMVFTEGGAPSPAQQLRLAQSLGRQARKLSVAVVSDSTAVRFTASALALALHRIRTFRRSEFDQACAYLELDEAERMAALETFELTRALLT